MPRCCRGPVGPAPATLRIRYGPRCVARLVVDGGTRFRLPFAPEMLPARWAAWFAKHREPQSREAERAERDRGGRIARLPLPSGRDVAAQVTVGGVRRQVFTFYVLDRCWARVNVETGELLLQLKARELWGQGYERAAARWLGVFSLMLLGRDRLQLQDAHALGWRMTGLELCCDFVGLGEWQNGAAGNFVGVRTFSERGKLPQWDRELDDWRVHKHSETLDIGTRASPVSLCLYDKDAQLYQAKPIERGGTVRGDDSIYRPVHLRHGWDGFAPRQRVEVRINAEGLCWEHRETGEVWDFRDPWTAARAGALEILWRRVTTKKRMVLPDSHTRRENCTTDPRWVVVQDVVRLPVVDFEPIRQRREVQAGSYEVKVARAVRSVARGLRQLAALHDVALQSIGDIRRMAEFAEHLISVEGGEWREDYQDRYRELADASVGEEIRMIGRARWESVAVNVMGLPEGSAAPTLEETFGEDGAKRLLAWAQGKKVRRR